MFKKTALLTAIAGLAFAGAANAAIVASTNFDARTLSPSNTANNLNWTTDGVDDPGSMVALNASESAQAIFDDAGKPTKTNFTPGLNTGAYNTFWTTEVSLTVSAGSVVTLEDVTFNYAAVNGSQDINVNRGSDFTLTLLNPSDAVVETITIADTIGGTGSVPEQPLITFDFVDVTLNLAGTYTLVIKGGDFIGNDETGNHTGIDNLSINGTVTPEPSSLALLGLGGLLIGARRRRG